VKSREKKLYTVDATDSRHETMIMADDDAPDRHKEQPFSTRPAI